MDQSHALNYLLLVLCQSIFLVLPALRHWRAPGLLPDLQLPSTQQERGEHGYDWKCGFCSYSVQPPLSLRKNYKGDRSG